MTMIRQNFEQELEALRQDLVRMGQIVQSAIRNAVDALVQMISLARQFELQVKMMETAKSNDAAANQAMRIA